MLSRTQASLTAARRNGGSVTLREDYISRLNGVRGNAVSVKEFAAYGKFLSSVYANNSPNCWQKVNFTA